MPITPHAIGEPLLKQSSSNINSLPVCNDSACCLSLVCKKGDGTSKAISNLLNDNTYRCICAGNCVIYPDKQSKVRII